MNHIRENLLTRLRTLIASLGNNGGQMGPSVYDTAQVLRLLGHSNSQIDIVEWLLSQQQADGGWGNPAAPLTRHVPTLAAILALKSIPTYNSSIEAGLSFIRAYAHHWEKPLPNDLPVAIELILPHLLHEAMELGLDIPFSPYSNLLRFGELRRRKLAHVIGIGSSSVNPIVHSYEAWGTSTDPALIDATGGVGLSPAATAAWIRATRKTGRLANQIAGACDYLTHASASTGANLPGIFPLSWPINRFEQAFGLYALLIGGLLHHRSLQDVIRPQLDDLFYALRPNGLGFCDQFHPDGDDTAAALAVLRCAGYPVAHTPLLQFDRGDHFCSWTQELQPSVSVTAHAVHTLSLFNVNTAPHCKYLLDNQDATGKWEGDKWNSSWLYSTSQAIIALASAGQLDKLDSAVHVLCTTQHDDGGWGMAHSTAEETAYALFALRYVQNTHGWQCKSSIERAETWMVADYISGNPASTSCWLSKELYRPPRISSIFETTAILRRFLDE